MQSYSNSPLEILPLLHELGGHKVMSDKVQDYSGHPLIADADKCRKWFYLILSLVFLLAACLARQPQLYRIRKPKMTKRS
jgi:hypothetical protein